MIYKAPISIIIDKYIIIKSKGRSQSLVKSSNLLILRSLVSVVIFVNLFYL